MTKDELITLSVDRIFYWFITDKKSTDIHAKDIETIKSIVADLYDAAQPKPTEEKEKTLVEQCMFDAMDQYKKVMLQREEIITAFIAKYGCEPEKLVQVEQRMSGYLTKWFVTTDKQTKSLHAYNQGFAAGYLQAKPKWLPIESAPRDGYFLTYMDVDLTVCFYHEGNILDVSNEEILHPRPTHWQPLPEPPEGE